jgi:uncharacterized RDD family membrane protein YckC
MSNANGWGQVTQNPVYPLAPLPASALSGVRRRRLMALLLDLLAVTFVSVILWVILGVATLGLAWFLLPPLFPFVAFFYNGLTISGWRRATPGMKAMDLEMRLVNGAPTPFLHAAVHAVLFYLTWSFPPLFLVTFLTTDKRLLHDMLAGVIVLRRAE